MSYVPTPLGAGEATCPRAVCKPFSGAIQALAAGLNDAAGLKKSAGGLTPPPAEATLRSLVSKGPLVCALAGRAIRSLFVAIRDWTRIFLGPCRRPMISSTPQGSPASKLALVEPGSTGSQTSPLSVDGVAAAGPNLSQRPGNRTPLAWRADLSAAIALRFARACPDEQRAFLANTDHVVDGHYTTDGFAALLAVLRPDVACRYEDILLSAAGVGCFGVWHTWRGFAIDRIVQHLARPGSPVAGAFRSVTNEQQLTLARYQWLLENAESVIENTGGYRDLYEAEMSTVQQEIDSALRGAIQRDIRCDVGLSTVTTTTPLHRITLDTLAGAFRVLHVHDSAAGFLYCYHDRIESWCELLTTRPPQRRDLRPLRDALRRREPEHDGASWHADPPDTPTPQLYFGPWCEPAGGQTTRELRPSRLQPAHVAAAVVTFFATPIR